jgi:XRE family transcriptional regulator, regulator of sulfur utilization
VTLAEKIVADRKLRGFSQEELAERASISLRTVQRIEKGESIPRGYTLQTIAGALNKPVEEYAIYLPDAAEADKQSPEKEEIKIGQEEVATYLQLLNLSALSYMVLPYLNLILPIVLWRRNKHVKKIDEVGRKVINFQVFWTVALHVALLLLLLFQVLLAYYFQVKAGFNLLFVFLIMYLLNALVIIRASAKLKKGNFEIYPYGLPIL